MSTITLVAFGWDKFAARSGRRRVSERTLHILEIFGGWPGSVLAMQLFAHKRRKPSYYRITYSVSMAHVAL